MLSKIRKEFPYFQQKDAPIYLDTAATAHKPEAVIEAMNAFYRTSYATVHRAVYKSSLRATEAFYQARQEVATFLNAKPEEILFTKGTTEALNLIASSFALPLVQEGDEILVLETEHHANIVPWQQVAQKKKARLIPIAVLDDGTLCFEDLKKKLSPSTKLICIAHIANVTGVIHPIKEVAKLAHEQGAFVVVDGAQSAAHLAVDVQELDADFYAFSGHKAYGPTGVGVLFGKHALLSAMQPYQFGGDMIEKVTFEKTTFKEAPFRFEAGTPMIAEVIGLQAALAWLQEVSLEAIFAHEKTLTAYALAKMKEHFPTLTLLGDSEKRGAIISFNLGTIHHLDLGAFLDASGICVRTGHLCAQPTMKRFHVPGAVRVSFGVYNTLEEIDLLIQALERGYQLLK